MAERRYRVRVFVQSAKVGDPGMEDLARGFHVKGRHADRAAVAARARLEENRAKVVSLSHGPENTISVTIAREPLTGTPKTLVANLPRESSLPRERPRAPARPLRSGGAR